MSWFARLATGLKKTSSGLSEGITGIFTKRRLDDAMLEELEELLLIADTGVATATTLTGQLRAEKFDRDVSEDEVKQFLAERMAEQLAPVAEPLSIPETPKPYIVLVVGVNGNGKTTTIGKLAARFSAEGKRVMLAAADTFRAAAIDQLRVWAERANVPLISGAEASDPASVAFQAVEAAHAEAVDVLMIDTAGRLHNKENLMAELEKILRVIRKRDATAPHAVLQVIDGTTGQNALRQVEAFRDAAGVTGLIVTKLDGSAKAGVVLALTEQFGLPIHAIGVGEGIDDLQPFVPEEFAQALLGMPSPAA